ncbi:MAG TPA: branched-chain amino acid ABC transporter permease, partial [Patescibacteria group bacterium]|nr:branched-chain amino acid ABC transporter permease [Patescibacteria group bacterium]
MELSGNVNYIVHLFIYAIAFIVPALALNLAVGYTGMLSVCQIAFSGIAGYTTAILMTMHGFSFLESMLASVATASITAFVLGLVLTRVRGDYFALATVGFNIIVVSVLNNWESLTRGPFGIPG